MEIYCSLLDSVMKLSLNLTNDLNRDSILPFIMAPDNFSLCVCVCVWKWFETMEWDVPRKCCVLFFMRWYIRMCYSKVKSITTVSQHCISRWEAQMRMRLCTGSAACWRAERILYMWLADWSALPARMWVSEMITKLLLNPSSRLKVAAGLWSLF